MRVLVFAISLLMLWSCGSDPKPAAQEAAAKPTAPKPSDESARFPTPNLVDTKVIEDHLMGKAYMPGGTVAHYKAGKREYDMFVGKTASATDAASLLLDWKKDLKDAKFIASFGGYFGQDGDQPVFVFSKGAWIVGVRALPEKDADLQARTLAARVY